MVFLSNRLKSACLPLSQVQRLTREGRPVLGRQAMLAVRCLLLAFAELPAFVRDVYVMVDELAPGRLLHSLKSGLSGSY